MLTLLKRSARWLYGNNHLADLLPHVPQDLCPTTRALLERVQPFTMTSPQRLACLCRGVAHVVRNDIAGAIVECGVWKGGSMMAAALMLRHLGATRPLYLFDTFTGMTPPTDVDRDCDGRSAQDWLTGSGAVAEHVRAVCPLAEVRAALASTGYDPALISFIAGPVEETLPAAAPEQIALLRLDTDWYASTRHELVHLFPRLSPGGILIIDDYGHWQGARRAVDDYLAEHDLRLPLHTIDYTGRLAIKSTSAARGEK